MRWSDMRPGSDCESAIRTDLHEASAGPAHVTRPKGSPHDAEDLAAFMRQHPRYADPATHPPTLRPFAAECLSRRDHTGQSRIMLLDRSIVSPRSVREGVLDVDLRETYVTPPALAARDYDPTKPRQERGDSVTSDAATDGTVPGRRFWVENE